MYIYVANTWAMIASSTTKLAMYVSKYVAILG